jgi:RNA polymerase sigma-70 factor, ECF subfamily
VWGLGGYRIPGLFLQLRGRNGSAGGTNPVVNDPASAPQPGQADDEQELIRRARQRDAQALHQLVDRYAHELYATAVYLVGNHHDAADLVQETLLGMTQSISQYRGDARFKTWLWSILLRQAARIRRQRARLRPDGRIVERITADRRPASDAKIDVQAAMEHLSEEHRQILVLREFQGLSYAEISEAIGVPRGTVESRLYRARAALAQILGVHDSKESST